ncbi:microspherule protein 1 [Tetranychus urticae]|uniref:FHA domain-containing protein n=1 Tax=Tetranychus urticae TaxID=32264 RepID=T1KEG1_TETUR|nr:microspherule protein 1 [Tetranychus urticae]
MASVNDLNVSQTRRSSSRNIKRKKFDDELVESSISHPRQGRSRTSSTSMAPGITGQVTCGKDVPLTPGLPLSGVLHSPLSVAIPTPTISTSEALNKRPKPVTTFSKRRRHRQAHNNAVKDIGRWKAQDDLALILAVQQTNNLEDVYRGVKFSCKFTLKEIENRWYALLYDPTIAKISVSSIRQLHTDVIALTHRKTIFSQQEEDILKTVPSASLPTVELFEEMLSKNTDVFLTFRTAKCLLNHWTLLKHHHLLPDQSIQYFSRHQDLMNFSDGEDSIEKDVEASLGLPCKQDDILHSEHILSDRKNKREIRRLENEIPRWQVLVDSITGVAPSDFDNHTLAVLRGRLVRYLMRSREITLGRCTKDSEVDVNLSLEGPAAKISRKQGLIKLQPNGDFMLANTGKRPIYVDSKPIIGSLHCAKLFNNSVVEIAGLKFVFLINQDLIAAVRTEALKSQM